MFSVLVLVSGDVKAGPRLPLHHSRHLNPFALVAFYSAFTAAQVFNIDQSLLLFSSFITSSSHSSPSSSSFSLLQSPAVTLCFPTMFLARPSIRPVSSSALFLLPHVFFLLHISWRMCPVLLIWLCGHRGHA